MQYFDKGVHCTLYTISIITIHVGFPLITVVGGSVGGAGILLVGFN